MGQVLYFPPKEREHPRVVRNRLRKSGIRVTNISDREIYWMTRLGEDLKHFRALVNGVDPKLVSHVVGEMCFGLKLARDEHLEAYYWQLVERGVL